MKARAKAKRPAPKANPPANLDDAHLLLRVFLTRFFDIDREMGDALADFVRVSVEEFSGHQWRSPERLAHLVTAQRAALRAIAEIDQREAKAQRATPKTGGRR